MKHCTASPLIFMAVPTDVSAARDDPGQGLVNNTDVAWEQAV